MKILLLTFAVLGASIRTAHTQNAPWWFAIWGFRWLATLRLRYLPAMFGRSPVPERFLHPKLHIWSGLTTAALVAARGDDFRYLAGVTSDENA
jgi:hypothetical protein